MTSSGGSPRDLRVATGQARGFSRRNLFYMRRLAEVWPDAEKVQTLSAQIGWSHHQVLLDASADQPELYLWYAAKAAENRWSVRHLQGQIALRLHERQGAAVTNFAAALESADADRALQATNLQATKDPYVFDFLKLAESAWLDACSCERSMFRERLGEFGVGDVAPGLAPLEWRSIDAW